MGKITLVNADSRGLISKVEHLGLGYLASALKQGGYETQVIDASFHHFDKKTVCNLVLSQRPTLLGFTLYYSNTAETIEIIKSLRKAGFSGHITLGGHHATFNAADMLHDFSQIDSIVLGEGEGAIRDLADRLASGTNWQAVPNLAFHRDGHTKVNECRPLISPLDSLACPNRDSYVDFMRQHKIAAMVSSRGCYGRCTFCSISTFYQLSGGKRWRARSAENLVDEIEALIRQYGIERVNFLDDDFMGPGLVGRKRARAIGEALLRRKLKIAFNIVCRPDNLDEELLNFLKQAGLFHISIGIESWVPRQLALYGKGTTAAQNTRAIRIIERLGIDYMFFLIPADPYVTVDEILKNLNNVEKAGVHHAADGSTFNTLVVFKGTKLKAQLEKAGLTQTGKHRNDYIGPISYEFMDTSVRQAYKQWQTIEKEYLDLRFRMARLGSTSIC